MKDPFDPLSLYSVLSASGLSASMGASGLDVSVARTMAADSLQAQEYLRALGPTVQSAAAFASSIGSVLHTDHVEKYISESLGMHNPIHALAKAAEDAQADFLKAIGPSPDLKHLAGVHGAILAFAHDMSVRSVFPGSVADFLDWEKEIRQSALPADLISGDLNSPWLDDLRNQALPYLEANPFWKELGNNLVPEDIGLYSGSLREIAGGIDWEGLSEQAWDLGESFASDLSDGIDDEPPTLERLGDTIASDQLQAFRHQFETAVLQAVQKALGDSQSRSNRTVWMLGVLLWPLVLCLVQVICQPLFQRWLEQRDAIADAQRRPGSPSPRLSTSGLVVVLSNGLNLRAGPSTTQQVIAIVCQGQTLRVLKRKHSWALVAYVDPEANSVSYTGWVKTKYVRSLEQETLDLVVKHLMRTRSDSDEQLAVQRGSD